jgi:hypothetical protein
MQQRMLVFGGFLRDKFLFHSIKPFNKSMLPLSDFASYFDIARFLICSYDEQK